MASAQQAVAPRRSMWGFPGVAKHQYISNGIQSWGVGNTPLSVPIQSTGIIDQIRLITYGSATITPGTGSIALDALGPDNLYTNITLAPNAQSPIVQASGVGLRAINYMKAREGRFEDWRNTTNDYLPAGPASQVYAFPATGTAVALRYPVDIPILQYIAGLGTIGYFPMQNNQSLMSLSFTPNSASASSPYNVFSTVAGNSPYLVTGNATGVLASPTLDIVRGFWTVPADPANFPLFQYVSTWLEDVPIGSVAGATTVKYIVPSSIGYVARLGAYVLDSNNTQTGYVAGTLSNSNSLQLLYDNNTPLFQENEFETLTRMKAEMHDAAPPSGVFTWDLLGQDLSMSNLLDTFNIANITVQLNFSTALGSGTGTAVKMLRQVISPLVVKAA